MSQIAAWVLVAASAACLLGVHLAPTAWGQWLCGAAAAFGFSVVVGVVFDAAEEKSEDAGGPADW